MSQDKADILFIRPNELTPADMLPVTVLAPEGTYLAIGTERGFMGLAMNPHFTSAILVDINPAAVLYNRINIKLLRLARDHADYLWLRSTATYEELKPRLDLLESAPGERVSAGEVEWFRGLGLVEPDSLLSPYLINARANYVKNKALCERLILLAKQNLITSFVLNISDERAVKAFVKNRLANRKLSVVDLSNAWWDSYAKVGGAQRFLAQLQPRATDRTMIMLTHYSSAGSGWSGLWRYYGFSYGTYADPVESGKIRETLSHVGESPHLRYIPDSAFSGRPKTASAQRFRCESLFISAQ